MMPIGLQTVSIDANTLDDVWFEDGFGRFVKQISAILLKLGNNSTVKVEA